MKVLATSDGSPRSWLVVPHAERLAQALNAQLHVVYIVDGQAEDQLSSPDTPPDQFLPSLRDALQAQLDERGINGVALVRVQRDGDEVATGLLGVVESHGADVVAMSSRGWGVLRHAPAGSVALGVLSRLQVPMLLAGEHVGALPPTDGPYHILVTTDGSPNSLRALDAVANLVDSHEFAVTLLRVMEEKVTPLTPTFEQAREQLAAFAPRFTLAASFDVQVIAQQPHAGVDEEIVRVAQSLGVSAIAIATHGHSARYHVFMGAVALGVLQRATVPLLLVRSSPTPP